MLLPKARGDVSEFLFEAMHAPPRSWEQLVALEPTDDDDLHIALWATYELHYQGFDDVEDDLEWQPEVLAVRRSLERRFEAELRGRFEQQGQYPDSFGEPYAEAMFAYIEDHDGPSLAAHVQREADRDQVLELLRHRSIYHLKEADPTTWTVPRLPVRAKASLVELLYDEYGGGDPRRLHSHLFARGMEACGLRADYGAYIDDVPVEVLEQNNAMSLFGLHRRLRGAALGHLAAFEATSSQPSRKMAQGLARLGFEQALVDYYEEHVEADAVHEQLAVRTICGTLVEEEPHLATDTVFGAFTCLDLEDRFATRLLAEWSA